jgi:hypothetical protein
MDMLPKPARGSGLKISVTNDIGSAAVPGQQAQEQRDFYTIHSNSPARNRENWHTRENMMNPGRNR